MDISEAIGDAVTHATGRAHRADEAIGHTGGPAGNARLTAWTGMALLVLFLAEIVTLIDVRSLISWHVAVGVLLIPPALLKTGTTGWRMARYYAGSRAYRKAGPPPMAFRVLGPLVVVTTLALLGSGVSLILITPASARSAFLSLGPLQISALMMHKGVFVIWAAVTGSHTLARIVPALSLTVMRPSAPLARGSRARAAALAVTTVVAIAAAVVAIPLAKPWQHDRPHHFHRTAQGPSR